MLQSSNVLTLFNTSDPAMRTGSAGEETATQVRAEIPDEGYDLVIMNPPFTSEHQAQTILKSGVLKRRLCRCYTDASDSDQEDMAKRLKRLAKDGAYHGHAGHGMPPSPALADKKVRPNGVIAPWCCLLPPSTDLASWAKLERVDSHEIWGADVGQLQALPLRAAICHSRRITESA